MKNKLQEQSALFFNLIFLIFSLCTVAASLLVCYVAAVSDPRISVAVTAVFTLIFAGVSGLFYRYFCKKNNGLLWSLLLCFAVRFLFVSLVEVEPFSDFRMYHSMAVSLANGEQLFSQYGAIFPHTVGFSWVLSLVYRLFGEHLFFIQLFNVCAETLTAYLLYLSANRLFDKKIGILTVFLYGISPAFIFYSELLATEILFTLFVSVLLYFVILFGESGKIRYAVFYGVITALLNAIRPMGLLLLLAFGVYTLCFLQKKQRFLALLMAVFCYLGVHSGVWYGISSVNGQKVSKTPMGYNLYIGSNYQWYGKWNPEDYDYANRLIYRNNLSPDRFHKRLQEEGILRYQQNGIRKNCELFVQKFGVLWGSEMLPTDYMNRSDQFSQADNILHTKNISNGFHWFLLAGVLLGTGMKKKSQKTGLFFIMIFVLGITAQHLIAEVQERYSYTALALLMPVAAYGITRCYDKGAKLFVQATSGRYQSGDGERPRR